MLVSFVKRRVNAHVIFVNIMLSLCLYHHRISFFVTYINVHILILVCCYLANACGDVVICVNCYLLTYLLREIQKIAKKGNFDTS